ncbi:MAG TPA: nuclear transport factor 2 family protein [Candidatus Binatia bacterium]|nr:nuclear transport factor 2 family protein [Candidatus Binatia bacterium]
MASPNTALIARIFGVPGEAARDIDGALFLGSFTDDVRYTVIGALPLSGTFVGRDQILGRLLGPLMAALDGPLRFAVDTLFGDGDLVAMQGRGFARTKAGRRYDNTYCFVFRFRGGAVAEITEYLDTELVRAALGS